MAERNQSLTNPGFFQGISNRARLIMRLMGDKRISPLLKLLPIGSLVYLVVPLDLMPIIPVDDAAILWLGSYMFVELCPQDVVQEHWDQILKVGNVLDPKSEQAARPAAPEGDVVDAEFIDIGPDKR